MESAQRAAVTPERVLPYPFWVGLASCATADVKSQLLQTTRAARTAVVQAAPSVRHTAHLSSPSAPDTLSLMRTSCRTLPASVVVFINNNHYSQREANHITRLLIPRLACAAITRLSLLGVPPGKGWLMDTGLLQDIHDALPGLKELDLKGMVLPPHPYAYTCSCAPLTTIQAHVPLEQPPEGMAALLVALGVRSGGSVTHLRLVRVHDKGDNMLEVNTERDRHVGAVVGPLLHANHFQALRKLQLSNTTLLEAPLVRALIHNTPALEHLKLREFAT